MITSAILFVLLGTLPCRSVMAAYIDYEPIKITVNENFNAQPGQIIQGLPTVDPGFVHQGANFYFKPQLNLPPGYLPSHIETLISSIRQKTETCKKDTSELVVGTDKITDIIKPLDDLMDFTKETLSETAVEKEKITEIVKPLENLLPELVIIPEETTKEIFIKEVKISEVSTPSFEVITDDNALELVEKNKVTEILMPLVEPLTQETLSEIVVEEEENTAIETLENIPELVVVPEESTKKEILVEEVKITQGSTPSELIVHENLELPPPPSPLLTPITINEEPKPVISELVVIPEAPVLPPLSLDVHQFQVIPHVAEEEVKIEEPILLENSIDVLASIPDPIKVSEITLENTTSVSVEEEVKIKESVLLEGSIGVISQIPEIFSGQFESIVSPIPEPIRVPEVTLVKIPSVIFEEEVKIGKPIIYEGSAVGFPPIPEISTGPIPKSVIVPGITKSFVLENTPPVFKEEIKIEETINVLPPIADISTTDSFVFDDSHQKPCAQCGITIKENLPTTFIPNPPKKQEVFTYVPIASYLSNSVQTKAKEFVIPKLTLLQHILHKNNPFRLSKIPFSKLPLNIMTPFGKHNKFQFPTSRAHNIVQSRISPHMIFRKKTPKHVKINTRSNIPKFPS